MAKRLLLCLICLLLCAGCGAPVSGPEAGVAITDADGNTARLTADARVVCGYASFAQCWMLAGGLPVGVTRDAVAERGLDLPAETAIVGTTKTLDLERIVALEPDYVVLSADLTAHRALDGSLTQMGIAHGYFRVDQFADYKALMAQFCAVTGRGDLFECHVTAVEAGIAALLEQVPASSGKTALLLRAYSTGAKAKGREVLAGQMLADLGVVNLADENPSLLEELSLEEIIRRDPDYIFVVPMGDEQGAQSWMEQQAQDPAWSGLRAVKEGRYHLLPQDLFHHKPNHRWEESYGYLARILYPELF